MSWTIETFNQKVDTELEQLPDDMQAKFVWISNLIKSRGLERVGAPYVKHIQGDIWEMRLKGRDGISRALYVVAKPKRVVVVRVFVKKTQKTPRKEIELALARVKEIEQ
jgi:phage-related protein